MQRVNDLSMLYPLKGNRLLGLDLGSKTIGVAISDSCWKIATPLLVIRRKKFNQDTKAIEKIILERKIAGIVLGLPINMDAREGARAQSTRAFARNLREKANFSYPIALWDERLSTVAMERSLITDLDSSRAKRAAFIDQAAAGYILQGALDALNEF